MGWMPAVPAKGVLQGCILIDWLSSAGERHLRSQDTGAAVAFLENRQRPCIGHRID
jgi:hypothetical protein